MCLQYYPFNDGEEDEVDQLERRRGFLALLANVDLGIPKESLPNKEIRIEIGSLDDSRSSTPQTPLIEGRNANNMVRNMCKAMRQKLETVGQKPELFNDKLLLALVAVTGPNALQMSSSPSSSSTSSSSCSTEAGHWCFAMAANCTAFVSLLYGVILRSKRGSRGKRKVGNILVLIGISLTVAVPFFNLFTNYIPGRGSYFVPLACLVPILGTLTL